jgi:hypothetical protein
VIGPRIAVRDQPFEALVGAISEMYGPAFAESAHPEREAIRRELAASRAAAPRERMQLAGALRRLQDLLAPPAADHWAGSWRRDWEHASRTSAACSGPREVRQRDRADTLARYATVISFAR